MQFLRNMTILLSWFLHYGNMGAQVFKLWIQRVPALHAIWDLEKTVLHEICVSGTVVSPPTNAKIPHLHVRKPKTVVVEPC